MVAASLHTFSACLNDALDVRRDRAFWPRRPIPSGQVAWSRAVVLALMGLLIALASAVGLSEASSLMCLLTAAAILFYNAAGKFVPAVGIVTVGLVHALNMLIPNPRAEFLWPLWLTMTHVTACGAIAYWLEGKRPALKPAQTTWLWAAWAFLHVGDDRVHGVAR